MRLILRNIALTFVVASMGGPLLADEPTGPPAWQDGGSVYLTMSQKTAVGEATTSQVVASDVPDAGNPHPGPLPEGEGDAEAPAFANTAAPVASAADNRQLPPPSKQHFSHHSGAAGNQDSRSGAASRRLAEFGVPMQSMWTILSALTIVIGVFLVFTWVLRRSGRMISGRQGQLPADVVSVLGRVPLAARQFAELLRVGNKLVLVSLTPTGAETLTEVTDPAEVDRLVGLCQQNAPFSTTKAFEQVFQQMSSETAPGGFLGNEAMLSSLASPAGAYRSNRGGSARG